MSLYFLLHLYKMNTEQAIEATRNWINKVVIGCHFCPFAAREMQRNSIHYRVEESLDKASCLLSLIRECERLDTEENIETTLLIFPNAVASFRAYLDLVALSEKLLKKQKYEGIYQLAGFHPDYRFSGSPVNDAANYTNRSPLPAIQVLREESISKALAHYPHKPETIPKNNVAFARSKGLAFMKALKESAEEKEQL